MAAKPDSIPQPLRCAIYTRKSTAAGLEKDFNSLDAQREACAAYIRSHALEGWVLAEEIYEDGGFTGANTDRPGFRKLLEHVTEGRVQIVVVYKVDRLSRTLVDFAHVMDHFTRHGAAFVSVTQAFSTTDPVGRLTLNMLMSFAEFEREMITSRIRDKVAAARRKGKWTGGKPALGYEPKGGRLQIREDEAPWVGRIFGWYLEGLSALAIAEQLNDASLPMKTCQTPRPRPWTKNLVLRILRNRLYLGLIGCQGEFVTAEHPALLDADTFNRAQRLLDPKVHHKAGVSRNPAYLLRGTLRCGLCGALMTSASTHRDGRLFRYYRCTTRNLHGRKACPTKQLPTEAIEAFVLAWLRETFARPEQAGLLGRLLPEFGDLATSGFDALWEVLNLRHRQSLVRMLVEEVVVDEAKGSLQIQLRDPVQLAEAEVIAC